MKNPAVANVVTFSGLRPPVARAEDQLRHLLRHAEGLVAAHRSQARMRATSRRRSAPSTPTSGRHRHRLQSAADPGHQRHRRLRVLPAGPLRRLARAAWREAANKVVAGGQPAARAARRAARTFTTAVPQYRTDVDRDKATRARHPDQRHLRHHAELVRQPLRQRLLAVRPHLSRQPVVGSRLPRARRTTCATSSCAPTPAPWCR